MSALKKSCLCTILLLLCNTGIVICQDSVHTLIRNVSGSGGVLFSHNEQNYHYATAGESIVGNVQNENNLIRSGFWSYLLTIVSGIEANEQAAGPGIFKLYQNYPNPFNPTTIIKYDLPKQSMVKLEIFNILAERIITLVNSEIINAGYHQVIWNGRNESGSQVASGIYFYKIEIKPESDPGNQIQFIRKMIFIK